MLQSIVHIALVVRDYDEAIDFYTNRLHFTLIEDSYQPEQDKRWVVVAPAWFPWNHCPAGPGFQTGAGGIHREPDRRACFPLSGYR